MLFPRNTLASGPQACFLAGKRIAKVKVGMGKKSVAQASPPGVQSGQEKHCGQKGK
jgi:hypothetical protein